MTETEAYEIIRNTFDDDNVSDEQQTELFTAIYGRKPEPEEYGLEWSLAVAATPGLCGCSTRYEHEQGACKAAYRVRVWDEGFSTEWEINDNDQLRVIHAGGIPTRIIQDATITLLAHIDEGVISTEPLVAAEFVSDDNQDAPHCTIEIL